MKKKFNETKAKGIIGHLIVSGGNASFLTEDKIYKINHYDFEVKILDKTAELRYSDSNSKDRTNYPIEYSRIDYIDKRFKDHSKRAFNLKGTMLDVGRLYFQLKNQDYLFEIWHQHLKIEIIDDTAYIFENDKKYMKFWDGYLGYLI